MDEHRDGWGEDLREWLPVAEVRAAVRRAKIAEQRVGWLQERVAWLEEQLRSEAGGWAGEGAAARPAASTAQAGAASAERAESGRLDLNLATFEALRALGLSVSQSARFIGQRDARGGFRSVDDLDRLYGLPGEVVQLLKHSGTV